jgi:tetratricopeptide (TPR) repeat protein
LDEALEQFQEAARLRPYDPVPHRNWAQTLVMQGKPRDAIRRLEVALEAAPDSSPALADLAWLLATHPDADIRAPQPAVRLAERAAALTGHQDPRILDVLSVASAAALQFERAVTVARTALALAAQRGASQLAEEISARLRLFEQRRSYIHDVTADRPID